MEMNNHEIALECITREAVFYMTIGNELLYANAAFLRLFDYTSMNDYNSQPDRTIFGDVSDDAMIRTRLAAGDSAIDVRVLCKTGKQQCFWGLLSFIRDGENNFVGAIVDISTLVEKEQFLRNNVAALAASNMQLDRFVYSASHDIRAPISTVMGLISLINMEPDHNRKMELIGMISSTMNKLDFFVHQLSTHSQNTRRDIEISSVDIESLISGSIARLSDHASYCQVQFSIAVNIHEKIYSDGERLSSILYYIIKNSLDYIDREKSQKNVDVEASIIRSTLLLEIFDNGIGIPADKVSNVFDMFYRASANSSGSGLGLYLVREMVTRLDGVVSIHSKLGVGTLVRLEIPIAFL